MSAVRLTSKLLVLVDVLLLACGLYLVTLGPLSIAGDATSRYKAVDELMLNGTLGSGSYSMLGPALAAPLWKLGNTPEERYNAVAYFNLIVFVVAMVALYASFRTRIGPERTRRFLILLLFGTAFPHELQNFNNEVLSSLALGCGLIGLLSMRRASPLIATAGIVVGTANMPGLALGAGLASLQIVESSKKLRYLLVPLLCAAAIYAEAWVRRGSPFTTGYEGNAGMKTALPYSGLPGFSYPFPLGALSLLLSFGKGLIFFYPGLFVPARRWVQSFGRELITVYRAWLLVIVGLVLVYSRWWAWYGGLCWGPRFFLFAGLPASLVLALWSRAARSRLSALAACLLIGWALWVGFASLVFPMDVQDLHICSDKNYRLESFCWYVPEFSVLFRPFIVVDKLLDWQLNARSLFVIVYMRITLNLWHQVLMQSAQELLAAPPKLVAWLRAFHI